jgi:hypothetical protein
MSLKCGICGDWRCAGHTTSAKKRACGSSETAVRSVQSKGMTGFGSRGKAPKKRGQR